MSNKKMFKTFDVELTTRGPLFIGSGEKYSSKEYVEGQSSVYFPDPNKFYSFIREKNLERVYDEFILRTNRSGQQVYHENSRLTDWIERNKLQPNPKVWGGYAVFRGNNISGKQVGRRPVSQNKLNDIAACIKNAFGDPYVPGSSLKGLLRTIFLGKIVADEEINNEKYLITSNNLKSRDLSKKIEGERLRRVAQDMATDLFRGIRVSDSEPLSVSDLVIVQKIDLGLDGTLSGLPIHREAIAPDRKIRFTLTLDMEFLERVHPDNAVVSWLENIDEVSKFLYEDKFLEFNEYFYKKLIAEPANYEGFEISDALRNYHDPRFYLGGGAGYRSKTIVNDTYVMAEILEDQFGPKRFGKRGVPHIAKTDASDQSPLTMKLTAFRSTLYEFGAVTLNFIER